MPVIFLFLLRLYRVSHELKAKKKGYVLLGGDDLYQKRNVTQNKYCPLMVASIELDMSIEDFKVHVNDIIEKYLPWYKELNNSIIPKHKPENFASPVELFNNERQFFLDKEKEYLTQINFVIETRRIILIANHIYVGGYLLAQLLQLILCEHVHSNIFPKNKYYPLLTEMVMIFYFSKMLFKSPKKVSSTFQDDSLIKRFHMKRNLAEFYRGHDSEGDLIYFLIANHALLVMNYLKKNHLSICLPISFENTSMFNTVGAIVIDVNYNEDFYAFVNQIKREVRKQKYQASASNHLQRIIPTKTLSQYARGLVDLTLTIIPQKAIPSMRIKDEMERYQFTMDNIRYPVYIMVLVLNSEVHSSFMINSPAFDLENFMREKGLVSSNLPVFNEYEADNAFVEAKLV